MRHLFQSFNAQVRVAILLTLSVLLAGCSSSSAPSAASEPQAAAVVATINDRPLSAKVFEMFLKNGREELGLDPNTEEGRQKIEQLKEGIISEMIDRMLLAQGAENSGLKISPEKMVQAEQRTIQAFGGEQKYDASLKEFQLTRDEYRELIKLELYGELMRAELNKDLSVTDDEIKKYYEAHKADPDFQIPERVTAAHILIAARPNLISQQLQFEKNLSGEALKKGVTEEMDKRRARAEELRRKAGAGADFAQLAREHSEDPSSKDQGGDLGTFPRNSHTRAFDDAAFALAPGKVGEVLQTEFGFHVIKVSQHEKGRVQTLAEATPEIRRRLLAAREAAKLSDWLKEARRKAKVRINEPYRFGALKSEFPSS
ncbi:MAG TPA: peptidylprolyl isomerase [Pyrinomonadaceae bacterium]